MSKNYFYVITAIPAKTGVKIKDFEAYFTKLKNQFNNHIVKDNPKYISKLYLSQTVDNGIVFEFWTEKPLPTGRELQSMRRISEELAKMDSSIVIGKSHVLIAA